MKKEELKFEIEKLNKNKENPWVDFNKESKFLEVDKKSWAEGKFEQFFVNEEDENNKYQFPLPINGNFLNAEYLLLYSNPAREEQSICDYKDELLKCFRLEDDAFLVIPKDNKKWRKWYKQELSKYFNVLSIADDTKEISNYKDDFWHKFCFINYCAYATKNNNFDLTSKEIENIGQLESTKFIKKLVELGIKYDKKIIIVRTRENVWKKGFFKELELDPKKSLF